MGVRQQMQAALTVSEYAMSWLTDDDILATTRVLYERPLRLRVLPAMGSARLDRRSEDRRCTAHRTHFRPR